jgi:hypothetical protein
MRHQSLPESRQVVAQVPGADIGNEKRDRLQRGVQDWVCQESS